MALDIRIAGGFIYCPAGGGVALTAPSGASVYFQPGDDAAVFYETLEALDEVANGPVRERVVAIAFGPYFD